MGRGNPNIYLHTGTGRSKQRVFEPYYTTHEKGTGLGLAIVTSIVSDHQGQIRVVDNKPRGAKFVIEFPLEQRTITQRKIVGA